MLKKIISLTITICFLHTQTLALEYLPKKGPNYNLGTPSEFVFQSYPNQELIPIRLLGAVKKAGLYHVPKDMKLTTLLSLAGGTTSDADINKIMIANDKPTEVTSTSSNKYYDLENQLKETGSNPYKLKSNDIILVKNKKPFISSDAWRVISIISVSLTAVLTAIAIDDKL
jgi:hypothetical protein